MVRTRKLIAFTSLIVFLAGHPATSASAQVDHLPRPIARSFPGGLPPGAAIVDADTLSFAGGTVTLDLVPSAPTDGVCPSGSVCLWVDANYTGQRLTLSACDVDGDGTCDWVNLGPFNFNDVMTSWKNRKTVDAKWAWDANGGGTVRCMNAGAQNPQLPDNIFGTGDNDEASSVKIFKSDTVC